MRRLIGLVVALALLAGAIWWLLQPGAELGEARLEEDAEAELSEMAGPVLVVPPAHLAQAKLAPSGGSVPDARQLPPRITEPNNATAGVAGRQLGHVLTAGGEPIPSARMLVLVREASGKLVLVQRSSRTNEKGAFSLGRRYADSAAVLRVVHPGYMAVDIEPSALRNEDPLEVRMEAGPFIDIRLEPSLALTVKQGTRIRVATLGMPRREDGSEILGRPLLQRLYLSDELESRLHVGTHGPVVVRATRHGAVAVPSEVHLDRPEGRVTFALHPANRIDVVAVNDLTGDPIAGVVQVWLVEAGSSTRLGRNWAQRGTNGRVSAGGPQGGFGMGVFAVRVEVDGFDDAWARGLRFDRYGEVRDLVVRMTPEDPVGGLRIRGEGIAGSLRATSIVVWARGGASKWQRLPPDFVKSQGNTLVVRDPPQGSLVLLVVRRRPDGDGTPSLDDDIYEYASASAQTTAGSWVDVDLKWKPGRSVRLGDLARDATGFRDVSIRGRSGPDWPIVVFRSAGWSTGGGRIPPEARLGTFPRGELAARFRRIASDRLEEVTIPAPTAAPSDGAK